MKLLRPCALVLLACSACLAGESYQYWQVTVMKDGNVLGPTRLPDAKADRPPGVDDPITVTPKLLEGAAEYRVLRVPGAAPAAPTVEVVNKGKDTVYYWLQAHAGLLRSAMAGPVAAKDCDLRDLRNVIRWERTPPYTEFTVLRTSTPQPPCGVMHALIVWGSDKGEATDTRGQFLLTDYPCYPDGTAAGSAPIGTGPFLVGVSKGEPVKDTGELKAIDVQPYREVSDLMGTTDHDPGTRLIKAVNPSNGGGVRLNVTNTRPKGRYDFGGPIGMLINQIDTAGGHNDYSILGGGPHQKSFHIVLAANQQNYTAGQMATFWLDGKKYGEGDNVLFTTHTTTSGFIEDGGDEGTEIFMASANAARAAADYELTADANLHATVLAAKLLSKVKNPAGTGTPVVNLTQAVGEGSVVRVDDDMPIDPNSSPRLAANRVTRLTGEGTRWTAEMDGWYISMDCDTTDGGLRQWYRVIRVNSPTSLDIYAYTFFSPSTYLGHAANVVYHGERYRGCKKTEPRPSPDPKSSPNGKERYLLAPATTVAEYRGEGKGNLAVMPLKQPWRQGDKIQVVAGPQTNLSLGKFGISGNLMPQDFAYGLWIHNECDRLSNDPALYVFGAWRSAIKMELDSRNLSNGFEFVGKANPAGGILVCPADTPVIRVADVPVIVVGDSNTREMVYARERPDGEKIVGIGEKRLALGENVSLQGGAMLRGKAALAGDGRTTVFTVKFAKAHGEAPYVVASSNLPIGMGVTEVTAEGFTVTFAAPPPAGTNNIAITWIVVE